MATPKKPTVKITGKATTSEVPKRPAAPKTSISRGASIFQSPKITGGKATPKPTPKATVKPKTKLAPKKSPIETTRVGGIISIPKKPKKQVY